MMTPRQRMLSAYEGHFPDTVPVAPEFWYYVPARLLGLSMIEFERDVPHWQALQQTFAHYQCEGWGIVAPSAPSDRGQSRSTTKQIGPGRYEVHTTTRTGGRTLESRHILDETEPSWVTERSIKDFDRDWPAHEHLTLVPPEELDWHPVQTALDTVGEDYLLEVYLGCPFVDYAGGPRQGGFEQVIVDLSERQTEMEALQERFIDNLVGRIRAAFRHTSARSIFIASSWSSLSLLSPAVWHYWEKPVLEAAIHTTHECGGLIHHHFHGRCLGILTELADLGLDCICPFERPPGGDIVDLTKVREALGERVAFNGNVHTVETLIRGNPDDVRREVLEILETWKDSPRLIVGTGDQVGGETPEENIHAMIETVRQFGKREDSRP